MNTKIIFGVIAFCAFGIVSAVYFFSRTDIDPTGKIHTDLYEGASGVWDPQMQVLPFRPQEINEQTVGSATQLRLEWQKPEQTFNHFLVTITDPVSEYTRKESGEHDRVSLDPDALAPNTEYVFALQACLDRRCEKWLVAQEEYRGTTAAEQWSDDVVPILLNP